MILGFAHIAYSTATPDEAIRRFEAQGLTLAARYPGVPSHAAKWPLMERQAASHELSLLSGAVSVEVIAHDTGAVSGKSRLDVDFARAALVLQSPDMEAETAFFTKGLGFHSEGGLLTRKGAFPSWSASLDIVAGDRKSAPPPLDLEGFSCLAFYSTDPQADARHLRSLAGRETTEPFTAVVGKRRLEVLMLRSPQGTPLELIKVLSR